MSGADKNYSVGGRRENWGGIPSARSTWRGVNDAGSLIFSVLQSGFDTSHEGAGTDTGSAVHFRRVLCICYANRQHQKYEVEF